MAVSLVNVLGIAGSSTVVQSHSFPMISGSVGNLVVVQVFGDRQVTITAPNTWNSIRSDVIPSGTNGLVHSAYWFNIAGNEPTNFSLSTNINARLSGGMIAFSGHDSTNPIYTHSGTMTDFADQNIVAPSVTASTNGGEYLFGFYGIQTNTSNITPPTGMTEQYDIGPGANAKVELSTYGVMTANEVSGNKTARAGSGKRNAGMLILVKASSATIYNQAVNITSTATINLIKRIALSFIVNITPQTSFVRTLLLWLVVNPVAALSMIKKLYSNKDINVTSTIDLTMIKIFLVVLNIVVSASTDVYKDIQKIITTISNSFISVLQIISKTLITSASNQVDINKLLMKYVFIDSLVTESVQQIITKVILIISSISIVILKYIYKAYTIIIENSVSSIKAIQKFIYFSVIIDTSYIYTIIRKLVTKALRSLGYNFRASKLPTSQKESVFPTNRKVIPFKEDNE